jgi:hypothetical protein
MNAYRTYLTIEDPQRVVLTDIPFVRGQRVEILVVEAEGNRAEAVEELRALLKATQALPEARSVTDEEIAAEIAAYRRGM